MESAFVTQINSQQSQFVAMLESQGQLFNNQIGSQHDQSPLKLRGKGVSLTICWHPLAIHGWLTILMVP
jgi:hypothetical protein